MNPHDSEPNPPGHRSEPGAGHRAWTTRPIFVSSTFRDMHAERQHLRDVVFPELAERLRRRFHHLDLIDLRLGVETDRETDQGDRETLVLKLFLNDVAWSRTHG